MKYAVISDIHGNYDGLKVVLNDCKQQGIDYYFFVGDYIYDLPYSNEVVKEIMEIKNATFILGNKEQYFIDNYNDFEHIKEVDHMASIYHTSKNLDSSVKDFILNLKESETLTLESGKTVYLHHYLDYNYEDYDGHSPGYDFHYKMKNNLITHDEYHKYYSDMLNKCKLKEIIKELDVDVVLTGHIHLQGYGYVEDTLVITPGSAGMPLDYKNSLAYTIFDDDLNVTERRVEYDVDNVIEKIKQTEFYSNCTVWLNVCFIILKTGVIYNYDIFKIADELKVSKNETGKFYSNETFSEAIEIFLSKQKPREI